VLSLASATPRMAATQYGYLRRLDVRQALSSLHVPTLVLHTRELVPNPCAHAVGTTFEPRNRL
jgi:hypothetical protein